jgi:hypothetical protein
VFDLYRHCGVSVKAQIEPKLDDEILERFHVEIALAAKARSAAARL